MWPIVIAKDFHVIFLTKMLRGPIVLGPKPPVGEAT
jgi:hypothetical protein